MSTLTCRIELSKTEKEGIVITVSNQEEYPLHCIQLNKDSVTITSKKGSDTSIIVQKSDSIEMNVADKTSHIVLNKNEITIKCPTFKLDADKIIFKSTGDTKFSAMNLTAEASIKANFEGNITKVKGSLVNVEGDLVTLG